MTIEQLKALSVTELKAIAYDQLLHIQSAQRAMGEIEKLIIEKGTVDEKEDSDKKGSKETSEAT